MPDLYPSHSTGVSTQPVRLAAEAFLGALSDEQRAKTIFAVDDAEWRKWSDIDSYQRQGVSLQEIRDAQRTVAFDLMGAALSAKGYQLLRDIMRLNTTEGEEMNRLDGFNRARRRRAGRRLAAVHPATFTSVAAGDARGSYVWWRGSSRGPGDVPHAVTGSAAGSITVPPAGGTRQPLPSVHAAEPSAYIALRRCA